MGRPTPPAKPSGKKANRPQQQLKERYLALGETIARRERERQEEKADEEAAAAERAARGEAAEPEAKKRTPSALVEASDEIPVPPHSFRINTKLRCLELRVTLHKIPADYITIDAQDDRFHLDTLKWTKKYKMDVEYPSGIKVQSTACQAEMQKNGLLVCTMPITEFPEPAKEKQQNLTAARRKERLLRFTERGVTLKQARAAKKERREAALRELNSAEGGEEEEQVDLSGLPHTGRQKPKKLVDDKDALLAMAQSAWQQQQSKLSERQDMWWKAQKEQEELTLARLVAKAQVSRQKRLQLEQYIAQKKRKIEEMEKARPPLAQGVTAGARIKQAEGTEAGADRKKKQGRKVSFGDVHTMGDKKLRKKTSSATKKKK
eukprot:TRINITY_DN31235_c0_g1_i1.p1 TRINITY_DN31235_c0_g1~~TRINITY_DN31235_c0_g1_i1.p1  ORF type:complete len:391 (+),score=131.40 TRINITY_DN31235_c0_g1_i1:45-1175(+)